MHDQVLYVQNLVLTVLFILEAVIKIVAYGMMMILMLMLMKMIMLMLMMIVIMMM